MHVIRNYRELFFKKSLKYSEILTSPIHRRNEIARQNTIISSEEEKESSTPSIYSFEMEKSKSRVPSIAKRKR